MTIRTAVVGAGIVSGAHLSALTANPRTALVGVCDTDEDRARAATTEHGGRSYTDLDELLREQDLDWVHLCTPVQTHAQLGKRVLEAGVPVLIEKPITETTAELDELIEVAERHGQHLAEVNNLLFSPAMVKARRAVARGRLGRVRAVDVVFTGLTRPDEANRGAWTFELAGGEFEEGLPHPLYCALSLSGWPADDDAIQATTSLSRSYDHGFTYDGAQVAYRTDDEALGTVRMLSGTTPQRIVTVHGERRSLLVDLVSQTVVSLDRDYEASSLARTRNNLDRAVDRLLGTVGTVGMVAAARINEGHETRKRIDTHYHQIDEEVDALLGRAPPPVPIEQSWWTGRLLEHVRDAAGPRPRSTVDQPA